jgi:hypothetical protein
MLEAVAAAQILLLALVGLVVVVLAQQETQHHRPYLGLQIPEVAVVEMAVLLHHFYQELAAQVSSSLNTPHLHNPYSHSKALASG